MLALIAPIALPAGGGNRIKSEIVVCKEKEFYLAGNSCILFSSPSLSATALRSIELGTPIRVVRLWKNNESFRWAQVQVSNPNPIDISSPTVTRGWINV